MSEATPAAAAAAPAPAAVAPAAAPAAPAPAAAANGTTPNPPAEQPGHKVFAGNLSYATTDEGLKAFFAPVASDILSTQIILRGPRSAGYGFVAFSTLEAANKAVTLLNKQELDGRPVIVELAKPAEEKEKDKEATGGKKKSKSKKGKSKIKAAAAAAVEAVVPGATTTAEATDKPATTEDKPKKKRNSRKTKKAAATPNGEDAAAAPAATDAKPAEPKEKKEKVKKPKVVKPKRPVGEAPEGQPSKTMLFVANLGFSVNDAALAEIFTSAGIPVTSARVVCRRWGTPRRSKGYGFVSTDTEENQKKALELLQGKEIDGRAIAVKIAVDSPETKEELAAEKELSTPQAAPVAAPTAA